MSLFSLWSSGNTCRPERLGYSPYDFLTRDNEAHSPDPGDGYHSQKELRRVVQQEYDDYQRSGPDQSKWQRYQDSKRMLDAMVQQGVETVDYLPEEFADLADDLRQRAVELMTISYEMRNGGRIDQIVIDRARMNYERRAAEGKISRSARDRAVDQIDRVAQFLNLST